MKKRAKAVLMLLVWILGIFNAFSIQAYGTEASEVLSIKNSIVELLVSKQDGRFAVRTVEGSPQRLGDENAALLFMESIPETTFTTFRIDGKDYIYGNTYSGLSMEGRFIKAPAADGMKSTSTWKAGDITVTQKLELTDNIKSSDVGNVKISYSITNTGNTDREVGTRILLDMMLGSNDGSKISLDGRADISYESEAAGKEIPTYWRCTDSSDKPKVVAYGFIKGWGNTEPDRMTIAHWSALSTTKWDYSIDPGRNIGSALNDYKSSDSAVALYWEPKTLAAGETVQVESYYGLGNINESPEGDTFNLNILAPAKLTVEGEGYKENPFDIIMELDNSFQDSVELASITAELVLPEGLELAEGQESIRNYYKISEGSKQTAVWKVKAANTQKLKVLQYMVRLTCMGRELKEIKKFIIVPGFGNEGLDIGYTDIAPRNLYFDDEDNAIQLLGYGFDLLKDKSSYEMRLVNGSKGNIHYLGEQDITVVNDSQIRIRIPKGLETGNYRLVIDHKNDLMDYTVPQEINVTREEKYKSRSYGILVIKEGTASLVENEAQLTDADKSSAKLIIRGKVRSVSGDRFDVYGDSIAINNDIYYRGYGGNVLSVYKSGSSFIVKGDGELYMQSALMGKSMEITLKKGSFHIDTATALIEDEEGFINGISIIYVGYLPIIVEEIKIQNNGEVKIEGALKLENKYFNFLTGDLGESFIESDIKDMRVTNKKIDIDTEFTIPFPHWKLGDFESQYRHLKSQSEYKNTKITFFINTIKGAYGFKSKAQNLKLRLRDINSTMAFDKDLYPDYFQFENKYGAIPEPIGSTGLAFESIGGGIYGLKSLIDSLRYGILPTGSSIVARADIVDLPTYYARIRGYTMIGLRDIEAVLDSQGISLDGDGYIYFMDVGDITGRFNMSGGYIKADLDILDILIAEAYFGISSSEIKGSVYATVKIPDRVWLVGGTTVSGFEAGLSTKKIEGSIKFIGVRVGVAYKWGDGSVDFDVASAGPLDRGGIYTVNTKDARGRDVTVTYGTNIQKLKDIDYYYETAYAEDLRRTLALGVSEYNYDVELTGAVETAIIEMKYTSAETPVIKVTDPDGNDYALVDEAIGAENANYRNQIISADVSDTGKVEKRLFVTIPAPRTGEWKIESDKELAMTLYNARVPAAFEALSARQSADKIDVEWALNETDGSTVSLYLVSEDGISESVELGTDLDGSLGAYECDIPAGATTGSYKIYGVVKRDGTGFDDMYSEAFEIIDAEAPGIPTGFSVETIGNGMLKAEWDETAGTVEYRIYAVDAEGKRDKTVETMITADGESTGTTFGGTVTNDDGKEYGWLPDRNYRFALYAVSKTGVPENEIEHISKPAYSEQVYLPRSVPPEFTVDFTAENNNINIENDENGNEIRYVNTGRIGLSYRSDTAAAASFYVNGDKVDETVQKNYEVQLELKSGNNIIEVEAVGENGDKNIGSYEFNYDWKSPDLLVQSPGINDTVQAGTVLVSGKTTAGSRLYVNGTRMTVSDDGSFNEEYLLSDALRETITIASVDLAGNRTEYSAEVLNSAVGKVVRVQVMPAVEQLKVGESLQLGLYGVTEDGSEVLLDGNKVSWSLYGTNSAAAINENGLLEVKKPGEIIVSGQYTVSNNTTYEDALMINVPAEPTDDDDDDDTDEIPGNNISNINGGTDPHSLVRRVLNFKADEEIEIPGLMRLRFSGNESMPGGYLEVFEIKDLLKYRQQSGNKDFVSSIYDIRVPEGYEFNSPVVITIHFDKNKVKNLKHIAIYVYNEGTGLWEFVGGVVDEKNGTITAICPHFSKYAVMENSGMTIMTDMEGHWARDAVYRLIDRGIINGVKTAGGEYRFEPERAVTRAEFAKMLSLSEGYLQNETNIDLSSFEDNLEIQAWARPYMNYCSKKEWIKGKSAGGAVYMRPNDMITRAEAAVMISRALGIEMADKIEKAGYTDKGKIPGWAAGYIDKLNELKLMSGDSGGTFGPDRVLTRAEAAKIFDTYAFIKTKTAR
jgi:hypothetical protein